MQARRNVQDSHSLEEGARRLGKIRAFFYIGAGVLLAVVYLLYHFR
jgi:hypothetical protein